MLFVSCLKFSQFLTKKPHRRDQVKDVWMLPQNFWYEFHPSFSLGKSLPLHKSSFSLQNHWTWKDGQEVQSDLHVPSDRAWDSCFALSIVLTPGQDLLYPARPATTTPTVQLKHRGPHTCPLVCLPLQKAPCTWHFPPLQKPCTASRRTGLQFHLSVQFRKWLLRES